MRNITAANAELFLGVADLFAIPQQIQGFSADDVFDTEAIDSAEVLMVVDGVMSAGFIFVPVKMSITLQADSASNSLFDEWFAAEQTAKQKFFANATVKLVSIGTKWSMTNGVLTSFPPMPNGKKVLQPRKFGITWERISPASE